MKISKCFIIFLLILSIQGCAAKHQRKKYVDMLTKGYAPKTELTIKELMEKIEKRNTQIKSFKSNLKLSFEDYLRKKIISFKCNGKIAIEKPYNVRLIGSSFFGGKLFDIASDGNKFFIYLPKQGKLLTGSSNLLLDRNHLGFRLRPNVIMEAFMSQNFKDLYQKETCFYEYIPNFYILYIVNRDETDRYLLKKLWVNEKTFEISRQQLFNRNGTIKFEVIIEGFFDFGEKGLFPKKMKVIRPYSHLDLTMEFSSVEIDPELDKQIFNLKKPKHIEIINLD